jgi:hypothetical protein
MTPSGTLFLHLKKIISPLKRTWSLFEESQIPSPKDCFVLSLIEIGLLVLKKIF